ncbi:MAG: alpha/beta hydrolase [Desulfuromonadales bacterium]|nr:MAG: alpha/beta hydrolase [Desulfuromonadales bacterium]
MRNSWFLRGCFLTTIAIMTLLGACMTPAGKFDRAAATMWLQREEVVGKGFRHVVYWQNGGSHQTLHVYLDGDGTPIIAGRPANDPTPRNPLMLRLLFLDPGPAVYVGRPCYHGPAATAGCSSDLWSTARYSELVVSSLAAAIRGIMTERGYNRVSFFGHSGGGTLAMLLAERFPETRAIVTIAANLDIDAWADHHDIPRLKASLNPALRPPIQESVVQFHYVGGRDQIVPPPLIKAAVKGANARLILIDDYDHLCCWTERWPAILSEVASAE